MPPSFSLLQAGRLADGRESSPECRAEDGAEQGHVGLQPDVEGAFEAQAVQIGLADEGNPPSEQGAQQSRHRGCKDDEPPVEAWAALPMPLTEGGIRVRHASLFGGGGWGEVAARQLLDHDGEPGAHLARPTDDRAQEGSRPELLLAQLELSSTAVGRCR